MPSQSEVLEYFSRQYATGNTSFISPTDVCQAFDCDKKNTMNRINRLYAYGFLDIKIVKGNGTRYDRRRFRVKEKCIDMACL